MKLFERLLLAIAIVEIPLQIDSYLMHHMRDAEQGAVAGINVSIASICLMILFAMWITERTLDAKSRAQPLVWGVPLLVYLTTVVLSVLSAPVWLLGFFDIALLGQSFLLFFYLANRPRCWGDVQWIVGCIALSVAIESVFVILLRIAGGTEGAEWIFGPISFMVSVDGRPGGTLHSPVSAGSFLAMWSVSISGLLIAPVRQRIKLAVWISLVLGVLAVALTQTRGAIITVAVAGMVQVGAAWSRGWLPKWAPAALLCLGIVSAFPVMYVIQNRVQDGDEGSAVARKHLAAIAWQAIQDRPFLGGGAGNCHIICQPYANQGQFRSEWYYTIHCKYLLVWVETGLIGLLAFLGFLGYIVQRGWSTWRMRDRLLSPLALSLVAAVMGHMVHMLVDIFNSRSQVQALWCCAGLIVCVHRMAASTYRPPVSNPRLALWSGKSMAGVQPHGA